MRFMSQVTIHTAVQRVQKQLLTTNLRFQPMAYRACRLPRMASLPRLYRHRWTENTATARFRLKMYALLPTLIKALPSLILAHMNSLAAAHMLAHLQALST